MLEIGIVLFTLTEGYNLTGYLVNVCRGKLLAAFLNDEVFNIILADNLFLPSLGG